MQAVKKNKFMPKLAKKFQILTIICLAAITISASGVLVWAQSFFDDTEGQRPSIFQTATLDFSLSSNQDFSPFLTPTQNAQKTITIQNNGRLPIVYQINVNTTGGEANFCQAIKLSLTINGQTLVSLPLPDFNIASLHLPTASSTDLVFTASLPSASPDQRGQTCQFDFYFLGKQEEGVGFFDQEIASNSITAGQWQSGGPVVMIYPNGGEVWWVGRSYNILWQAHNSAGSDDELSISLWYSADSGGSWAPIVASTSNDGVYRWRVPLFIGDYFTPSERARIKVVAYDPSGRIVGDDISDEDFCPPIDFSLLTDEEREKLKELGWDIGEQADHSISSSSEPTDNQNQNSQSNDEVVDKNDNFNDSANNDFANQATSSQSLATSTKNQTATSTKQAADIEQIDTQATSTSTLATTTPIIKTKGQIAPDLFTPITETPKIESTQATSTDEQVESENKETKEEDLTIDNKQFHNNNIQANKTGTSTIDLINLSTQMAQGILKNEK